MMFIYFKNDMKYNQELKIDLEVYIEDCLL